MVVCLLLTSCAPKNTPQSGILTINLTGNLSREKEFFLSDIATDIEYVKLDNRIEATIQQVDQYSVSDEYLLIYDRMLEKALLFDRKGNFLRQIGRKGKGPGEYTQIQDISMDAAGKYIYLTHKKQIDTFSTDGTLVKTTPLPSWALFVEPFGDDFLAIFPSYYSTLMENYTFAFFGQDGAMKERLLKRDWSFLKRGDPIKMARLYYMDQMVCYNEAYYDTVYAVTPDRKVVPRIAFIKPTGSGDPMTFSGYNLSGWREFPTCIMIGGSLNRRLHQLVYERKSGELWHIANDTVSNSWGITNDLNGGPRFWGGLTWKDRVYSLEYAFRIKDTWDRMSGKPFTAKLPARRSDLEKLVAGITDDDGQVLTIVTLKK